MMRRSLLGLIVLLFLTAPVSSQAVPILQGTWKGSSDQGGHVLELTLSQHDHFLSGQANLRLRGRLFSLSVWGTVGPDGTALLSLRPRPRDPIEWEDLRASMVLQPSGQARYVLISPEGPIATFTLTRSP